MFRLDRILKIHQTKLKFNPHTLILQEYLAEKKKKFKTPDIPLSWSEITFGCCPWPRRSHNFPSGHWPFCFPTVPKDCSWAVGYPPRSLTFSSLISCEWIYCAVVVFCSESSFLTVSRNSISSWGIRSRIYPSTSLTLWWGRATARVGIYSFSKATIQTLIKS